ncbi:MAG: T9SS C-terminal target domain-containing protein [Flavobacteriia bacterium]|jgi:hypothetical protein|nr:MAG: T9SS C-terminal target domain-containing protein [Flavobacteriia bacterium]
MKKNYLVLLFALIANLGMAQIEQVTYRGGFDPALSTQWTDSWTNFDPQNAVYPDVTGIITQGSTATTVISNDITSNTTWVTGRVYELNGTIYVRNNATLTIQPGVIIRSNVAASALFVTRGSKLNAIGTASQPIVFTSKNAAGSRNRGDWGGIVLLGKGRVNQGTGTNFIEGVSQTVDTQYGGGSAPINNDNSGTLKYVRIEFAGYVYSPNNELNGLTMGGVGSGTTIDYVQVSYSNDDSFEWFGGSVDCKHLVALNGLDDDFDTDFGFNGRVQFGLSIKDPLAADISTSECFESDNYAGDGNPASLNSPYSTWRTSAIFSNFTCLGPVYRATLSTPALSVNGLHDKALRIRRASELKVFNSLFLDFKRGLVLENNSIANFNTLNLVKFQNNIISSSGAALVGGLSTQYDASGNTTTTTATTSLLVNPYPAVSSASGQVTYAGLDYRPGSQSIAASGASFSDATFTGILTVIPTDNPIVTTPITNCKGAVAQPLNVVAAPGTVLRWYTTNTATAPFTLTQPTISTSAVGTRTIYVAQYNATTNQTSSKVAIVINTVAAPAVALAAITNGDDTAAITQIGAYVGTTTPVTYKVPASTEVGVTGYNWTLPLGVNLVSQTQLGNEIVVNFNNVPFGAEAYGSIAVQTVNAAGCFGVKKEVKLTKVLPAAPATIVLKDAGVTKTTFAQYMGTNKELDVVAASVAVASSYVWELPTGVTPIYGTAGTPVVKYYSVYPFINTISAAPATSSANAGVVYYKVTETTYSNGIVKQEGRKIRIGGTNPAGVVFTALDEELTNLTNEGVAVNPIFPIISTTLPTIKVNFAGVTSSNSFNYSTTAATPVSTNVLRIGVKSRNGVGVSSTNNASATLPTTTSTAKLLTLKATLPAAVSAISGQLTALCSGSTVNYTLTASALASSYIITAPAGCVVTSEASPSNTSNVLSISGLTFSVTYPANFTITASTLVANKTLVVTSVNGMGNSLTNKSFNLTTVGCNQTPVTKLSEVTTVSSVVIYPNPVMDMFNMEINVPQNSNMEMSMVNLNGSVIFTKQIELTAGSNVITENISSLSNGVYLVRLFNLSNNEVIVKKLIKN